MINRITLKILLLAICLCSASNGFADVSSTYSPEFFHDTSWIEAVSDSNNSEEWKYALYNYRTLMVTNPEIYLQADKFWIQEIVSKFPGWGNDYLYRDRALNGYDEIQIRINDGYKGSSKGDKFSWKDFLWDNHIENSVSIDEQYQENGVTSFHKWLDRKIPFIWSAVKGENWQTDRISLAECLFLQMDAKRKRVWLAITDEGKSFVAEYRKKEKEIKVYDPLTGRTVEPSEFVRANNPVLIMNDEHVWYPLMNRDDRTENHELAAVVAGIANEGASPALDAFELSIRDVLIQRTRINNEEENQWAFLFSSRIGGQWSWRVKPILNMMSTYFPSRYREAKKVPIGSADIPYEMAAVHMMITEMSNRLSPLSAQIASEAAKEQSLHEVFTQISEHYFQLFSNPNDYRTVYGDYNHIWVPTMEDKMVSNVGNCLVEATNVGAVLSLLQLIHPDWNVYVTNWWMNNGSGGHVIAGVYSDQRSLSLSNGNFGRDGTTFNGPLFNYNNRYSYCLILKTRTGFLSTAQDGNNARFKYEKPISNMSREDILDMLQEIGTFEPNSLFVVGDSYDKNKMNIEEFERYLRDQLQEYSPFTF